MALTRIDLSYNGLTDAAVKSLINFLTKNNVVEQLDLSCNRLGPNSAIAIAEGLKTNTTLKELSLKRNPWLAPGCLIIAKSIVANLELDLELLDFSGKIDNKFIFLFNKIHF